MSNIKKNEEFICIKGAREHNLQNVNAKIPINKLTVITGVSGSGKSSLAFDTLYAEGQRRYVESLSAYARQFLGLMNKPDIDSIKGLSPAISIEQKSVSKNPRSTVGTITEIYDYLRLLYARVGQVYCYKCGKKVASHSPQDIVDYILNHSKKDFKLKILSPVVRGRKGTYEKLFKNLEKKGFVRIRVNNEMYEIDDLLEELKHKPLNKHKKHNIEVIIDRLVVKTGKIDKELQHRIQDAIETSFYLSEGLVLLDINGKEQLFSKSFTCLDCQIGFEELQPRMFSFNSPFGACEKCHGLGISQDFDVDLVIPDKTLSVMDGAILPWKNQMNGWRGNIFEAAIKYYKFDKNTPVNKMSDEMLKLVLYGHSEKIPLEIKTKSGAEYKFKGTYEGIISQLNRLYHQTGSEHRKKSIEAYMREAACEACHGERLKPESLGVKIENYNIYELTNLSIQKLYDVITNLKLNPTEKKIANMILKEISDRLDFLTNVGLDYLTLGRGAKTLSGGEAQRIRLATQIGSELRGVLYILDEPSIGLHQRDNLKLIKTLKKLRDLGNTVIVVEHDEQTMKEADHIIDMGPLAGVNGGKIIAEGSYKEIIKNSKSLTGAFLSGKRKINIPEKRRVPTGFIELLGAEENNLKNINAKFPLGVLCSITGVSGSGKSTLINQTFYKGLKKHFFNSRDFVGKFKGFKGLKQINKVISIDQSPIGRTPRSNPATYIKAFDLIRDLFSSTKESKIRGYKQGRFSFNVEGGRCENCKGDGSIKIEMHFLPDIYVECEKCKGKRYNRETLEVDYKGKNIADVLEMTVEEALEFFKHIPSLNKKLQTLYDVGLGYIKLGQSSNTLSGGEAQRIKLTSELSKRDTGNTLYILDEPTTGLHFADIEKLLEVLNRLVNKGNGVIVIEHNLDVIKASDYIIDLGPEGGEKGGKIVAVGTPEEVSKNKKSFTGMFL